MKAVKALKEVLYKADFFHSASLLRIKREPEHKTLLGGFISLSVMTILIITFYNKIIETFQKTNITSSSYTNNSDDPLPFYLNTSKAGGPFMFGVEVWHHNLNNVSRYFDVVLTSVVYRYGQPQNMTIHKLQQCTYDHWNGYSKGNYVNKTQFDQLRMKFWKCLPQNKEFEIKGKYSSKESMTLNVALMKCTNRSDEDRPCAPQQEIDAFFLNNPQNFYTIYFLNALINSQKKQQVLKYYLQDVNYIIFSSNGGSQGQLLVEDFTIQTDESIFLNKDIRPQIGGTVTEKAIKNVYSGVTDTYATFIFFKSETSKIIERSFDKLDLVLSYIGGLFGTILIFFFVIGSYNTYKFEVNLAGYLYRAERDTIQNRTLQKKDEKVEKVQKQYNFFRFLGHGFYTFLRSFQRLFQRWLCFKPEWEPAGQYHRILEEMLKQLDILFLLKRVNFLEYSLSFLFSDQQLKGLHLAAQPTIANAAKTRRNYKLKHKLKNKIETIKKAQRSAQNANENISNNNSNNSNNNNNDHSNNINHNNLNELINVQSIQSIKEPANQCETNGYIYHKDQDNYSSEDLSSSSQQQDVVRDICQLSKDEQNQMSRKIWKNVDSRFKDIILSSIQADNNQQRSNTTGNNNLSNGQLDQNSLELEVNLFDNQDINKEMRNEQRYKK